MADRNDDCDARRERWGLLLDGETSATAEADLFLHLGGCADCRAFADTLLLLRQAAGRERAAAAPVADALALPPRAGAARAPRRGPAGWRVPVPAAAAAAVALLLGGALLGAALTSGAPAARGPGGRQPVVVVCSLPEVVVR